MITLEYIATIALFLLLGFWRLLAAYLLNLCDDYATWRRLRNCSLTTLTFWEYWRDEC